MIAPFQFNPGPTVICGEGSANRLTEILPEGPCLFVTDPDVLRIGLPGECLATLRAFGREIHVFSDVEADPSKATLLSAVDLGRANGVTHVVGFGGGSPMDVAKLASYLLGSGDDLDSIWGLGLAKGRHLPLALVPTTAGTGSETTPVSVITCESGEKKGVNSPALTADWAILDATLTMGMPRALTAATGIDAMVHAIEAYTCATTKNPISDVYACEALRHLAPNLVKACLNPGDRDARGAMMLGAHLAGMAFSNAPVAGVHALAYPLGGLHHLPHGLSNALMLRPVLQHNSEVARELYAKLADIVVPECQGQSSQARCAALIEALDRMVVDSGLQPRLRDHQILPEDIPILAREAMKQQRLLKNNPVPIEEADAVRLYEAAW